MKERKAFYKKYVKRWFDFVIASFSILILLPVFLLISVLVLLFQGWPIVYKQSRPGREEKLFTIYKFRTMSSRRNDKGELLPDNQRLTRFGRMLRATSLDELPELFNILKGDMSLVGPRPLLVEYLPRYNEEQRRRHEVRPGLTGLAQVKGRNLLTWEDRFQYDISYLDQISFLRDMKIIFLTITKTIRREGIHSNTSVTMEHFSGTNNTLTTNSKKDKLLILGAGGHGRVIADVARKMNCWTEIAFLEDNPAKAEGLPFEIIAKVEEFEQFIDKYDMIVGIGANQRREAFQQKLETAGASMAIILHPSAILGGNVTIGQGSVVMAGVIINTGTKIGKGCILNTAATIDHENNIEDFVHLSPGVHTAGNVKVGTLTWLGIGSSVIQNITIAKDCMIGAGAVVVDDLLVTGIYLGVPAKLIMKD